MGQCVCSTAFSWQVGDIRPCDKEDARAVDEIGLMGVPESNQAGSQH